MLLFNILEKFSKNILEQYKWNPFKKNYLSLATNPTPFELPYVFEKINKLEAKLKIIGHIHLINNFYMFKSYQDLLKKNSVPIINDHPSYFKYINREALETLNFNFSIEEDNDELITYYIENYRKHPIQTVNYFKKALPYLNSNSKYSYFISTALNDEILNINDTSFKNWVKKSNKNIEVFYNTNLFKNMSISASVDKFIAIHLENKQKNIIYNKIVEQLVKQDDLLKLPPYFVDYLKDNNRVFNIITLFKHYYAIKSFTDINNLLNNVSESTLLRVYLTMARVFFKNSLIKESLNMTQRALSLSPINHQVFRNFIRIYHFSGNITGRVKYLKLMKLHFPDKIYGNELEMAIQEESMLNKTWTPTVKINSPNFNELPNNKKILFVLNKAYPVINGYTVRSDEIIQALYKQQFEPVIATRLGWSPEHEGYHKTELYNNKHDIYFIDQSQKYLTYKTPIKNYLQKYTDEIEKIILKEKPNYIYAASNFQNALPSLIVGKHYNIPTVYEVRGMWQYTQSTKNPYFYQSERFYLHEKYEIECCKLASRVTCICNTLKDYLVKRGINPDKIEVISNGVNTKELTPLIKNKKLESKYDLRNKIVVGFVGSITAYEGLDYLIEAVKLINKMKLYHKEFILLIVGEGNYLETLKKSVIESELDDYVKFVGRVSRELIPEIYSLVDIAPFPRINIPLCQLVTPLKPYEAMSFAKKVLVSDLDALKEMVVPEVNGLTFKANDTNDLIKSLLNIVDNNEISLSARKWVKNNKDWEIIGKELLNVLEKA